MTKEFNILVHSFPLFSSSPAQREGGTTERRSRRERRPEEAGDVREERSVSGPYRRSSVHSLHSLTSFLSLRAAGGSGAARGALRETNRGPKGRRWDERRETCTAPLPLTLHSHPRSRGERSGSERSEKERNEPREMGCEGSMSVARCGGKDTKGRGKGTSKWTEVAKTRVNDTRPVPSLVVSPSFVTYPPLLLPSGPEEPRRWRKETTRWRRDGGKGHGSDRIFSTSFPCLAEPCRVPSSRLLLTLSPRRHGSSHSVHLPYRRV